MNLLAIKTYLRRGFFIKKIKEMEINKPLKLEQSILMNARKVVVIIFMSPL